MNKKFSLRMTLLWPSIKIILIYLLFGGLWIFFSDKLLLFLIKDIQFYSVIQTIKGWLYVIITAFLLFILVYNELYKKLNLIKEKDILLSEVHHRVKNNLALITSLLLLQLSKNEDKSKIDRAELNNLYLRIQSMALVHKNIYLEKNLSLINLNQFIMDLTFELKKNYKNKQYIQFDLHIESIKISVLIALPLGLILNEILNNSIRHSISDNNECKIKLILIEKENQLNITISDNGKKFDLKKLQSKESLGINIINNLIQQIQSNIEFKYENGLIYTITIPLDQQEPVLSSQN